MQQIHFFDTQTEVIGSLKDFKNTGKQLLISL